MILIEQPSGFSLLSLDLAIPVTFTKNLEERVCNFGDAVEFTCETSKACRVEWSCGDKRLSPSQVDIESVDHRHTLRLPKVKLTDKGWYKCAVQDAFTEAKLTVIGKEQSPPKEHRDARVRVADKPVELVQPLEDLHVQENENGTLVCQLSKPDMEVVWYHNDRRIFFTSQSRIRAKQIDCFYKLLLDDIEDDDRGLYELRCEQVKTSCHLTVKKLETTFLDHLRNLTVQEGVSVTTETSEENIRRASLSRKRHVFNVVCRRSVRIFNGSKTEFGSCRAIESSIQ